MTVIDLEPGEVAAEYADRIVLIELPNGMSGVSGVVLSYGETVTMVTENLLPTLQEARAMGIAWAQKFSVERLYVERPGA